MFEVSKKSTVKTRKQHECFGCCEIISKGEAAVYVRGKEDENHFHFHLHVNCHIKAMKRKLFAEGFTRGAIKQTQQNNDFSVAETSYPF